MRTKLNKSEQRIYRIWAAIKSRTSNPNVPCYRWYGAKGIQMCDEWKDSFDSFLKWSTENGYSDDLTIDRINSSLDYCPNNCRWITIKEQQHNRCNNLQITINGETKCLSEWARIFGINRFTVRSRHFGQGMDWETALTMPICDTTKNINKWNGSERRGHPRNQ